MIKELTAIYTGGGIWVFYGSLITQGQYFLTSDDGWTLILDKNVEDDLEEGDCFFSAWQDAHLIKELSDDELKEFQKELINRLKHKTDGDRLGGFTEIEADRYANYWKRITCEF